MNQIEVLEEIRDLLKGMSDKSSNDELLTSAEVAEFLKISVGHFVNVLSKKDGFPKPIRISKNGGMRWRKSEIIGYLK